MGQITLQVPVTGQLNATEDPKIASDMTTLQTVLNGNIDAGNISPTAAITGSQLAAATVTDANLASPNNGVRRLLLQATGALGQPFSTGDYLLCSPQITGSGNVSPSIVPPLWVSDAGLSSQPTDFQVAGKSPYVRVRATVCTNATNPGVTIVAGLYQVTAVGGGSGVISYTFGAALGGTTGASPGASTFTSVESGQIAMPVVGANLWGLGVNLNGPVLPNAIVTVTAQLYAYNA